MLYVYIYIFTCMTVQSTDNYDCSGLHENDHDNPVRTSVKYCLKLSTSSIYNFLLILSLLYYHFHMTSVLQKTSMESRHVPSWSLAILGCFFTKKFRLLSKKNNLGIKFKKKEDKDQTIDFTTMEFIYSPQSTAYALYQSNNVCFPS